MAILKFGDNILSYDGSLLSTPSDIPNDGYWIHYDTGTVNLISLDDPNIVESGVDIVFNSPSYLDQIGQISLPEGVTRLGNLASAIEMTHLILPSTLKVLLNDSLGYTQKMRHIEVRSLIPPSFDNMGAYVGDLENLAIYVPSESLSVYKTDPNWGEFESFIFPIPD